MLNSRLGLMHGISRSLAIGIALTLGACASTSSDGGARGGVGSANGGTSPAAISGMSGAAGAATGPAAGGSGVAGSAMGGATSGGSAGVSGGAQPPDSSGGAGSGGTDATGGIAGGAGSDALDAGAPDCAGLVCEDFESGVIDTGKWDIEAKGGTIAVQQQRVRHGKFAALLHGLSGPADDWALLVLKNVPAALKGTTTFGRLYFYLAPEATASIHIQFTFAGHNGTGSANGPAPFAKLRYLEAGSNSGKWQLGFDLLDVSPLVEEVSYSSDKIPTNAWACLEWELDDRPDRVSAWINGAPASSFDNTNVGYASPGPIPKSGAPLYNGTSSDLIGGFDTFGFGFHDWHPKNAFDLYYDDVVLDSKRIGCP